LLVWW